MLPQSQSTRKFFRVLPVFSCWLSSCQFQLSAGMSQPTRPRKRKNRPENDRPLQLRPRPIRPLQPKPKYEVGEDPEFAKKSGWPVQMPPTPEGAILPAKRIVAYYGNPQSKEDGSLG